MLFLMGAADLSSAAPAGLDLLKFSGDMRLRLEGTTDRNGKDDQLRGRARFRIGAGADLTDELMLGFRVRAGANEKSPYNNFGDFSTDDKGDKDSGSFDNWSLGLDRAYLKYSPKWLEGAWVQGGKFAHPFKTNPVFSELVWDEDVQPEGFSMGYSTELGKLALDVVGGFYSLSADMADDYVFVAQGHAGFTPMEDLTANLSLGVYAYETSSRPINYTTLNPIFSLTCQRGPLPITLSSEFIANTDDDAGDDDTGWSVGASTQFDVAGHGVKPYYQYSDIDKYALNSEFEQDDFSTGQESGGAGGYRGHIAGVVVKLTKKINVKAWGLFADPKEKSDIEKRFRLDLSVKF